MLKKPKLLITKTNKHFYVQLLCLDTGKIVLTASTLEGLFLDKRGFANIHFVDSLALLFAKRAFNMGFNNIIYNQNKYSYRGKVKIFLDKLRSEGINFAKES